MRQLHTTHRYQEVVILFCIFALALLPRMLWLNTVPAGISNDELDYVLNAKAFFLLGHGLTGTLSPIRITQTFPNAELISILIAPVIGPFPFSLFLTRVPFAVFGGITSVILYLLAKKLLGKKQALIVSAVAILNPWNIYFSRTTYDAPVTTLFFLIGFLLLLTQNRRLILFASIPFLLGFHTYMGMMTLFPFFIVIILIYAYTTMKNNPYTKEYITVGGVCMLFVIRYAFLLPSVPGINRMNELATINASNVTTTTNTERRLTLQTPFRDIINNKGTSYLKIQMEKYFDSFSPSLLFLHGDPKRIFTLYEHGFFYPIEALFLILGVCVLFATRPRIFFLFATLAVIAPIPTLASGESISYASRAYLLQPILIMTIGSGISYLIEKVKWKRFAGVTLSAVYAISFAYFLSIYFLRNPVANSESSNTSAHIMALYAQHEITKGRSVVVVADKPETAFKQYTYYMNLLTHKNAPMYVKTFTDGSFTSGSFRATTCVTPEELSETTTLMIEGNPICPLTRKGTQLVIPQLADAGVIYEIYQGKTCSNQTLERYPHDILFSDLGMEKLPEQRFCNKFIIQY
jgi:hypothetical protein